MYFSSLKLFEVLKFFQFLMLFENQFLDTSSNFGAPVNEKSSIVVRLLRQPGRNAFTTSESIYDLYSKHENYKDSTSKSKEIHFLPISEKNVSIKKT